MRISEEIDALEVNISCPNVASEGETFACDPQLTARVTAAVRKVTEKTVIVKLSPNVTDIGAIARVAESAGADALAVVNTVRGMAIDVDLPVTGSISERPVLPRVVSVRTRFALGST